MVAFTGTCLEPISDLRKFKNKTEAAYLILQNSKDLSTPNSIYQKTAIFSDFISASNTSVSTCTKTKRSELHERVSWLHLQNRLFWTTWYQYNLTLPYSCCHQTPVISLAELCTLSQIEQCRSPYLGRFPSKSTQLYSLLVHSLQVYIPHRCSGSSTGCLSKLALIIKLRASVSVPLTPLLLILLTCICAVLLSPSLLTLISLLSHSATN